MESIVCKLQILKRTWDPDHPIPSEALQYTECFGVQFAMNPKDIESLQFLDTYEERINFMVKKVSEFFAEYIKKLPEHEFEKYVRILKGSK